MKRKITITIDSTTQSQQDVDTFARYLLLQIQDDWEGGTTVTIDNGGYNMEIALPESF